ncbi:1-deoxy-D-xylulose-5-phosphate synthase [Romboutsia lituseburensis]|uniref:1-deoxy-D-xylulose-5-phosphate synthase n=1 Tax=Romboutsia lituseburensis DSM 797 TaxID=1121325 RepID=A0A1G9MTN4_9FIRM|nr:1-deoxy-D-xylulose-5-phosphate synthase [Romboutsia lituseburensis]CEH34329.1 1-deoxy-D-xylulose-5-phosphate synthase 1 [Romboutsia lituseburensis]SDL77371.1 1-deoxy-D-xylulose-5-phosphate synthase [Romboutsia lituseburensis DSM 797]
MSLNILNKINNPRDLKILSREELHTLSTEIRDVLIKRVSTTGGHFGPNLGMVEATIALHYVFNSPVDKFVYDVSHQSYTHKILTGRKEAFTNPEKFKTVTGYTEPKESEHDFFTVGHTSTSISLACGLAKGRDVVGGKENIVAIIGDGSLSGGEAYEGLNNAAASGKNIIILVNDNDMSIAENHGGLYQNLALLRETEGKAEHNFFKSFGFDYHFVKDGNDIDSLIETFKKVKDTNHPVVIHMHTVKGKGYDDAEVNKEAFHWVMPFDLETKSPLFSGEYVKSYGDITSDFLVEKARKDKSIVGITAATPNIVGLAGLRNEFKDQYVDVGIAEEHAIALASGIAKRGGKPVASFISSFIQRTYDQLSQDLAINNNPATILVNWGGISGGDVTHLGLFDIPLISNIPNIVYLAPTTKEEHIAMMEWAIEQDNHPVAIRVPNMEVVSTGIEVEPNFDELDKYVKVEEGSEVAIIGLGSFFHLGKKVANRLKEIGINATLINPRFITGVDEELLNELQKDHKVVITLEDGILNGGFGEKISRFYSDKNMRVLNFGADKEFTDSVALEVLYERYHLTEKLIVADIEKVLEDIKTLA